MRISTLMHGVIDYATAGSLFMMPSRLGASPALGGFLMAKGLSALGYSVMTRYELGLVKSLPMKTHLTLDGVSGATMCLLPFLFSNEPMRVRLWLMGMGLFELFATFSTDQEPGNVDMVPEVGGELADRARGIAETVESRVGGLIPA